MPLVIRTQGSCVDGEGEWSYTIHEKSLEGKPELLHSESGEAGGTTSRQMKLMAILKALSYVKASDSAIPILLISDCEWCVKCIKREFDCASDDEFRRDKVARGYVQYLQEIWWKLGGIQVTFQVDSSL